jgi:hypothetical protein
MSRNQWIAVAVLSVMIAFLSGSLAGYLLVSLMGRSSLQISWPIQPIGVATDLPPETPMVAVTSTPTATLESRTATSTRVVPAATYVLPPGPTIIPLEAVTPDDWEPDDSLMAASLIAVGETQTHNLHVEGDRDWLYFGAEEGTTYVIETSSLGGTIDTVIHLCDGEGNELASDDDGGEEFWTSRLEWTAIERGTLYVMIGDLGDNEAGLSTSYYVSLSMGESFEIDEYEPDDSRAAAKEIGVGDTQSHNLRVEGDRDWVYFEARAGMTYVIETSNLGGEIDTIIYLYDGEGNGLSSDDDKRPEFLGSRLEWTAEKDSTLYVMVRDLWGTSAGLGTEYDVSVSSR